MSTRTCGARSWIERMPAFVVTPEYDHIPPASLMNALQFLVREWAYKPAGFVSYGGVSAGTRSVQVLKHISVVLRMMPIPEAVHFPFFARHIDQDAETFEPDAVQEKAGEAMLDKLLRWSHGLQPLRYEVAEAA